MTALASALSGVDLLAGVEADVERCRAAAAEVSGVAARIAAGGGVVSDTVVLSKQTASRGVQIAGALIKTKLGASTPAEKSVRVAPAAKEILEGGHRLSEIALEGSRFALGTAGYTFKYVGTRVSGAVAESGAYASCLALARPSEREGEDAPPAGVEVHKAKVVMGTVLTSCLGVYRTVKSALWEFTDDLREVTVDLSGHVWGEEVAAASGTTFDAVRNVGTLLVNIDSMPSGPSNIALDLAKESGKDILALDAWLSGEVLAHGGVDILSPIATWTPQWLLLRASALLVYPVGTDRASRPVEVVTVADIQSSKPIAALPGDSRAQFEICTNELTYRLRARCAASRDAWLAALESAVAARKASAPRVVLSQQGEAEIAAEQRTVEKWQQALQLRMGGWEASLQQAALRDAERSASWDAVRRWAGEEAREACAECAADVSLFAASLPWGVEAALSQEVLARLAAAKSWALHSFSASPEGEKAERACLPSSGFLFGEAAQAEGWGVTPAALQRASEWAAEAETVLSPATAAAARRSRELASGAL
jgi:hypothetical protein